MNNGALKVYKLKMPISHLPAVGGRSPFGHPPRYALEKYRLGALRRLPGPDNFYFFPWSSPPKCPVLFFLIRPKPPAPLGIAIKFLTAKKKVAASPTPCYFLDMKTSKNLLKAWCNKKGRGSWTQLYNAIRAEHPTFTQSLLTEYISARRLPQYEVAKIIARETGIPLTQLGFKYIHVPGSPGELSQDL